MTKPKILVATPEIILGLPEGQGNLMRHGLNMSNGGMAPVNASYVKALISEGDFDVHLTLPKWESSLRVFNDLGTDEVKNIDSSIPDHVHFIADSAFNKVTTQGTNTMIYDDTSRFSVVDRAVAFSRGIINYVIPHVKPDILWAADWMAGPAAIAAKAMGIKVVVTGHNIFTHRADRDYIINSGIEIRDFDNYHPEQWVFWNGGQVDFMASGVNAADDFTTVSPGFLERILNGNFDGNETMLPSVIDAIKKKSQHPHPDGRSRVHGYLNPLEVEKSDLLESIRLHGLEDTIKKSKLTGQDLRKTVGLKEGGHLGIFPNRLFSFQKFPELLLNNALHLANKYDLRILFLANGDPELVKKAKNISVKSNGLISYRPFDKKLEEQVKHSDGSFGIMTPHYEPCGGPNINYPLEGSLIVGHAVDGIRDSVSEINLKTNSGTGFPFVHNDVGGLDYAIGNLVRFSKQSDNKRYAHYIRIAQEFLLTYSAKARAKQLSEEIFMPLYNEKVNGKK